MYKYITPLAKDKLQGWPGFRMGVITLYVKLRNRAMILIPQLSKLAQK